MKISISDIAVIRRQRTVMDQGKLNQLANSIMAVEKIKGEGNGLIHAINVRPPREDETYPPDYPVADLRGQKIHHPWVLVTGGRRTAAHLLIERTHIEAINFNDLDPLDREIVELEENLGREDINWKDELDAKARIHELRQIQAAARGEVQTQTETAKELGETKGNLSKDLQLHNLMKTDPSLAKATSKKAAIRSAQHKVDIANRVASLSPTAITDLASKLHTMDMRDFVRTLGPATIDLHFPDFPFGIDYDKVRPGSENSSSIYEDRPENLRDLLTDVVPYLVRSVKPTGWIAAMMGFTHYQFMAGLFRTACVTHTGYADGAWTEAGEWFPVKKEGYGQPFCNQSPTNMRHLCRFLEVDELPWVWYRPNSRQPSLWPERHANNQFELICIVNGGQARLVRPNVPNVLNFDAIYEKRIHEMQRPHDLCKEIISRLTVTGEKVVDVCFGSGAHLAAAADLGRDFEGCDINPANRGSAIVHVASYYKPEAVAASKRGLASQAANQAALAADAQARADLVLEMTGSEEGDPEDLSDIDEDELKELNFDGRTY